MTMSPNGELLEGPSSVVCQKGDQEKEKRLACDAKKGYRYQIANDNYLSRG